MQFFTAQAWEQGPRASSAGARGTQGRPATLWEETSPKPQALGRRRASPRWHCRGSGCWWSLCLKRRRERRSGRSRTGNMCPGPAVTDTTVPTTHRPALVSNPTQPKGAGGAVPPGKHQEAGAGDVWCARGANLAVFHASPSPHALSRDLSRSPAPQGLLLPPPSAASVSGQPQPLLG